MLYLHGDDEQRSVESVSILVILSCCNKNTTDWVTSTKSTYFSQFWRLGNPRSRHQQIRCLVRACFLVHSQAVFLLCPHMAEGAREISGVSYIRALISFMRAPPS